MPFGSAVHRLESVPSTNDAARALALDGADHGTAVVAREQTAGRGTRGRAWHSPAGLGLYASFVVRGPGGAPVPSPHLLPLAAGLAAADAVAAVARLDVRIKWPNDLVIAGRKLGGILVEAVTAGTESGFAVVGVGLNIAHGPEDFPAGLRDTAASLRTAGAAAVSADILLAGLCRALDSWYNALARGEKERIVAAAEARLAFPPGRVLRVATAAGTFTAVFRGLDPEGRLVVDHGGAAGTAVLDAVVGLEGA